MVQLTRILTNFNSLLNNRGIKVDYYDELLKYEEEELKLYLSSEDIIHDDAEGLDILKTMSDNYPTNLTTMVNVKDVDVIIYWSQTSGKTFVAGETALIQRALKKTGAKYCFVMCLYDKTTKKRTEGIEIFNYNDCLSDPLKMVYGVKDVSVMTYDDFISDNIDMEGVDMPKALATDFLVRYAGASPGEVLMTTGYSLLPSSVHSEKIDFRLVSNEVDKDIKNGDGEYYLS